VNRLNFVVADADEEYVESLVEYLISDYSEFFQVSSFTRQDCLVEFMQVTDVKVDILLIDPRMYPDSLPTEKVNALVFLSPGNVSENFNRLDSINKYQHADRLVSDIIRIFSEKYRESRCIKYGDRDTKVVAVYSPAGGTGKTCIAAASSIICSQMGLAVFYLNLENVHAEGYFSGSERGQNFSNIIYHLKEKDGNLALKIEGARCIHEQSNVHYFPPPDSIVEFDELFPGELERLIRQFKAMGRYDIVFVDMSSSLDKRNLTLLEESDEIFLILTPDPVCEAKAKALFSEIDLLSQKNRLSFHSKLTVVLNKYRGGSASQADTMDVAGIKASTVLPARAEPLRFDEPGRLVCIDDVFAAGIRRLVGKYFKKERMGLYAG